jgi:hypothetical protein
MLISAPFTSDCEGSIGGVDEVGLSRACEVHESSSGDSGGLAMAAAAVDDDRNQLRDRKEYSADIRRMHDRMNHEPWDRVASLSTMAPSFAA